MPIMSETAETICAGAEMWICEKNRSIRGTVSVEEFCSFEQNGEEKERTNAKIVVAHGTVLRMYIGCYRRCTSTKRSRAFT